MSKRKKIMGKGHYRNEFECPNCKGTNFVTECTRTTFVAQVCKVPAICLSCDCRFKLVYRMTYVHSKVVMEGLLPEPPQDKPVFTDVEIVFDPSVSSPSASVSPPQVKEAMEALESVIMEPEKEVPEKQNGNTGFQIDLTVIGE